MRGLYVLLIVATACVALGLAYRLAARIVFLDKKSRTRSLR